MSEWREELLGDVLELQRGFDIAKREQRAGPVPVVASSGVIYMHDVAKCAGPGVVIGRKGTLGTAFYVAEDYWPHATALWVRDFRGNDPRYCYLLLKTLRLQNLDSGASNPTLNRNHAHRVRTRIPGVGTQTRIADVLFSFDALIENNQRRVALLQQTVLSLYREWFIRMRFPDHQSRALTAPPVGDLPGSWRTGRLRNIAELQRATVDPRRQPVETFAHCSFPAYDRDQLPSMEEGTSIKAVKYVIDCPSVLLSKLNPRIKRVWLVEPETSHRTICSTEFLPLSAKDPNWLAYLYALLASDTLTDAIVGLSGGTSTSHQRASPDDVLTLPVVIPDDNLVEAFGNRVRPALESAANLRVLSKIVAEARDALLPRLVRGQVQVESLNVDDVFGWLDTSRRESTLNERNSASS